VEVVRHLLGARDAHVRRQDLVQPEDHAARRDDEGNVDMRALGERVDAGVRAPGAVDAQRRAVDLRERLLHHLLDCYGVGL
jgi:hypothetical protein